MRFWDSSVLLPLVVYEASTLQLRALFAEDRAVVVSFVTPLEITSAMWRRSGVNRDLREIAQKRYDALEPTWLIVGEHDTALALALQLVQRHQLRTGDAIQLACALIARDREPALPFVTLDVELAGAARAEGFLVLP